LIVGTSIHAFCSEADNRIEQLYKSDSGKFGDDIYYAYGHENPIDVPPKRDRIPKNAKKYTTDLFSLEQVKHALKVEDDPQLIAACSGPANNVDIWLNEEAMFNDLMLGSDVDALTAFCLDCRLPSTHHIAFLTVMGSKGNIVAMHQIPRRAESINFKNTTTLLASTQRGVVEWNWQTDTLVDKGFYADTHSLVWRESENKYYGCFPDKQAVDLHNPNTVCTFDGDTHLTILNDPDGKTKGWAWADIDAHMNYITVHDDAVYLSERSDSSLKKVNMNTNEVEWVLGGRHNTFTIFDAQGNKVEKLTKHDLPWNHQHKFQHLDDQYVSCFDNNVNTSHWFIESPWGKDSRMLLMYIDQDTQTAYEVFSYPTGDRARSYGGTDILPSGNLLGSSYVDWVFPTNPDYQYHQNIWEVTAKGDIAWRVGFKGLNIVNPSDTKNPYPHYFIAKQAPDAPPDLNIDIMPVGWNIYTVERAYPKPVVSQPCAYKMDDNVVLLFNPFNTVRTQEDKKGTAILTPTGKSDILAKKEFMFHKSWLPRPTAMLMPEDAKAESSLTLIVANSWNEFAVVELGDLSSVPDCPTADKYRAFYPSA